VLQHLSQLRVYRFKNLMLVTDGLRGSAVAPRLAKGSSPTSTARTMVGEIKWPFIRSGMQHSPSFYDTKACLDNNAKKISYMVTANTHPCLTPGRMSKVFGEEIVYCIVPFVPVWHVLIMLIRLVDSVYLPRFWIVCICWQGQRFFEVYVNEV